MYSTDDPESADLPALLDAPELPFVRIGYRVLVDHLDALLGQCDAHDRGEVSDNQVRRQFDSLLRSCQHLFDLEQQVMTDSRYPRAARHLLDHQRFLSLLDLHYRSLTWGGSAEQCRELLSQTAPCWLARHLRHYDLNMCTYVCGYLRGHPEIAMPVF